MKNSLDIANIFLPVLWIHCIEVPKYFVKNYLSGYLALLARLHHYNNYGCWIIFILLSSEGNFFVTIKELLNNYFLTLQSILWLVDFGTSIKSSHSLTLVMDVTCSIFIACNKCNQWNIFPTHVLLAVFWSFRWIGVATWRWVANDENCGICRMAFDGCCPDCKIPGDDCPLGKYLNCKNLYKRHTVEPQFFFNCLGNSKLIPIIRRFEKSG